MLIIVDKKISTEAKSYLRILGTLMGLETSGIVYPAISGHPDIFFAQVGDALIVAPNLPREYFMILDKEKTKYTLGAGLVGKQYPDTAKYNAVSSKTYLVHNTKITDPKITQSCTDKKILDVKQAYTRCNLIFLDDNHALTSDAGIHRGLVEHGINTLMVNPKGIVLPGFSHGFFGGCCGVFQNNLFVLGNLDRFADGDKVRDFVQAAHFEIVELCDTPLFDGGGILFIHPKSAV